MRFTPDSTSGRNVIRGYAAGELKINEAVFHEPVIVSSSAIVPGPPIGSAQELDMSHAAQLLALEPELVLLGTGARQSFPAAAFGAQFFVRGSVSKSWTPARPAARSTCSWPNGAKWSLCCYLKLLEENSGALASQLIW